MSSYVRGEAARGRELARRLVVIVSILVLAALPLVAQSEQSPEAPVEAEVSATVAEPAAEASDAPAPVAEVELAPEVPPPPAAPVRPILPSPANPVGPTEADFENARRIRAELTAFIEGTQSRLERADEVRAAADAEIRDLTERIEAVAAGSVDADALSSTVVDRLMNARQALRDSLDELRRASKVPSIRSIEDVAVRPGAQTQNEWTAIVEGLRQSRVEALALEDSLRWTNVAIAGDTFHRLTAIRILSFEKISPDERDRLFGTSREGLEQLTRELRHVGLAARYYIAVRVHDMELVPATAKSDYYKVGEFLIAFLRLIVVLAIAIFVRSRWRTWLHESRGPLFRWFRTINARRRLERLLGILEIAAPWLLLFATLYLAEWALGKHLQAFELELGISLLYYYGFYRLTIDMFIAGILRISGHYALAISAERNQLISKTVVTFFRVVFGLLVLGLISRSLLGGGYLSQIASRFAFIVVAITLLVLMLRWRRQLADAFLSKHSEGRIADLVRRTRDSWLGVFVAPASFVWILGRAVAVLARDFAMGFEQTQRALAFLFRRRIEKEAERRGYAAGDIESLPDKCLEAFSEDAIEKGPGLVEHFQGLDELRKDISAWREREDGRSFLLTGQRGVGKTTWLRQIRRDDVQVDRIWLGIRATSRDHICQLLADHLEIPEPTFEGLVRHLSEGEPRIVILDDAQHLFLTTVGGYDAWAAFTELVNRTKRRVFWVAAMSAYAWKHLKAVRADWSVFSRHQHLAAWNEERIRELLRTRMKASGLHYNYSSLVLERLEGVSTRDHLIESAEGYARLLWDYADGNPRVAIHFFLRSLDQESENRVKVRLFRAPEVEQIEAAGETAMFILSCIVEHESVSAPHIAEATRYPNEICRIHLDKFLAEEMIDERNGLYRVPTHWHRAVVRTLRRRNILTV